MVNNLLNKKAVLKALRDLVTSHGSQTAAADAFGVSIPYLNMVLKGKRPVGPKLLKALGIKKTLRYEVQS